jgi:hypothetical protein
MCAVDDMSSGTVCEGAASGGAFRGGPVSGRTVSGGPVPESAAEALQLVAACLDYLNSAAAENLDGPECGAALVALTELQGQLAGVRVRLLRRFAALKGHDADGYASATPWLVRTAT